MNELQCFTELLARVSNSMGFKLGGELQNMVFCSKGGMNIDEMKEG